MKGFLLVSLTIFVLVVHGEESRKDSSKDPHKDSPEGSLKESPKNASVDNIVEETLAKPDYTYFPSSPYSFSYAVNHAPSSNDFAHEEISDGETVKGYYRVLLPDGRVQRVTYEAGKEGYQADVKYDGAANYDYKPASIQNVDKKVPGAAAAAYDKKAPKITAKPYISPVYPDALTFQIPNTNFPAAEFRTSEPYSGDPEPTTYSPQPLSNKGSSKTKGATQAGKVAEYGLPGKVEVIPKTRQEYPPKTDYPKEVPSKSYPHDSLPSKYDTHVKGKGDTYPTTPTYETAVHGTHQYQGKLDSSYSSVEKPVDTERYYEPTREHYLLPGKYDTPAVYEVKPSGYPEPQNYGAPAVGPVKAERYPTPEKYDTPAIYQGKPKDHPTSLEHDTSAAYLVKLESYPSLKKYNTPATQQPMSESYPGQHKYDISVPTPVKLESYQAQQKYDTYHSKHEDYPAPPKHDTTATYKPKPEVYPVPSNYVVPTRYQPNFETHQYGIPATQHPKPENNLVPPQKYDTPTKYPVKQESYPVPKNYSSPATYDTKPSSYPTPPKYDTPKSYQPQPEAQNYKIKPAIYSVPAKYDTPKAYPAPQNYETPATYGAKPASYPAPVKYDTTTQSNPLTSPPSVKYGKWEPANTAKKSATSHQVKPNTYATPAAASPKPVTYAAPPLPQKTSQVATNYQKPYQHPSTPAKIATPSYTTQVPKVAPTLKVKPVSKPKPLYHPTTKSSLATHPTTATYTTPVPVFGSRLPKVKY